MMSADPAFCVRADIVCQSRDIGDIKRTNAIGSVTAATARCDIGRRNSMRLNPAAIIRYLPLLLPVAVLSACAHDAQDLAANDPAASAPWRLFVQFAIGKCLQRGCLLVRQ